MIFQCWEEGLSKWRITSGFISEEKGEGRGFSRAVWDRVVDEFS